MRATFGLSAAGGQNDFAPARAHGAKYVTLVSTRVGTKSASSATVGAHKCWGQRYVTLVLTRAGTNGRRRGTLGSIYLHTRVGGKVT